MFTTKSTSPRREGRIETSQLKHCVFKGLKGTPEFGITRRINCRVRRGSFSGTYQIYGYSFDLL